MSQPRKTGRPKARLPGEMDIGKIRRIVDFARQEYTEDIPDDIHEIVSMTVKCPQWLSSILGQVADHHRTSKSEILLMFAREIGVPREFHKLMERDHEKLQ